MAIGPIDPKDEPSESLIDLLERPLSLERAVKLARLVRFEMPGFQFHFNADARPDYGPMVVFVTLQARAPAANADDYGLDTEGRIPIQMTRAYRVESADPQAFLRFLRDMADDYMMHELDEWLKVDGYRMTKVHGLSGILKQRS